MALKYLKDTATLWLDKQVENPARDIQWIVTVPAIWSDAAKEVMRKAAVKVGLPKESMVFAYEPEAAALFSRLDFLRDEENYSEASYLVVDCGGGTVDIAAHKMTKQHGHIYIDELSPPEGGNCGGFAVNDQFENLILDILKVPMEQFKQLKINCSVQWTKLMNERFETSKLMLDPDVSSTTITLEFHTKICKEITRLTGKSMEELVENYNDENIEWDEDESGFVLHGPAIHRIFQPVLDKVCKLIKKVLEKPSCAQIDIILLVGGFAESALLFKKVQDSFSAINIYKSSDPKFCVVKGAILCGQHENLVKPVLENMKIDGNPPHTLLPMSNDPLPNTIPQLDSTHDITNSLSDVAISEEPSGHVTKHFPPTNSNETSAEHVLPVITKHLPHTITMETSIEIAKHLPPPLTKHLPFLVSRKMKYSIGLETSEPFKASFHDFSRRIVHAGEDYCTNVFFSLVKANDSVYVGAATRRYRFTPLTNEQSNCDITIFASESETVKYIDERGCHKRATVEISNLPSYKTGLSREVEICVDFYGTELEITAYCAISLSETKNAKVSYEFSLTV
ncbi:heat shock 70 kDa protein 12A-like isoform X2 [Dysidea avara]